MQTHGLFLHFQHSQTHKSLRDRFDLPSISNFFLHFLSFSQGMVKEDSPATENNVQKKKKIRFADDAGGDLCHVKVFEIDLESES